MKQSRFVLFLAVLLSAIFLLTACTGSVPGAEEDDSVTVSVVVNAKIVAPGAKDDGSDDVLYEGEVEVSTSTKNAVSIKDLAKTLVEENFVTGTIVGSKINVLGNYEADETHRWSWALNDNSDAAIGSALKEGDHVVFTYIKGSASGTEDVEETTTTASVSIVAGGGTLYEKDVTVESTSKVTVKVLLQKVKEESDLAMETAGSIKKIGDFEKDDANEWVVLINNEKGKLTTAVADGDTIEILYQAVEA